MFFLSFFLVFIYTFVSVANIITAPFNSFLAEKVELYLTKQPLLQRSMAENIKDVPRVIGRQLAILGYYIPRAIFVLILFFIPLVQVAAPLLWFLFNAWFLTFTYIDYPADFHRIPLKDVRSLLKARRAITLSLGMCILLASMIPILNFFVIPAAVAAATKFYVEEFQDVSRSRPRS